MNTEVRFSSPFIDDLDLELLENTFGEKTDNIIEILEYSPYEVSIIVSLLNRLETKLTTK